MKATHTIHEFTSSIHHHHKKAAAFSAAGVVVAAVRLAVVATVWLAGTVGSSAAFGQPAPDTMSVPGVVSVDAKLSDLHQALMSWAISLSGLPAPARQPRVLKMAHAFFVSNACGGRECKVWGWFPPGDTIYLDSRLDPQYNLLAASIVVHEMVHYLQFLAAPPDTEFSCAKAIELERQAYAVQQEFISRYGVYHPVGASMHQVGCDAH